MPTTAPLAHAIAQAGRLHRATSTILVHLVALQQGHPAQPAIIANHLHTAAAELDDLVAAIGALPPATPGPTETKHIIGNPPA